MGRLTQETTIIHFSHPHPLYLSSPNQQNPLTPLSCAACTLPCSASSWTYSCSLCSFHLHLPCSNLPQLINHTSHPHHSLTLLPRPAYPEGYFDCDACHCTGTGFSYHCTICSLDLHSTCASMALSVAHHAHAHPLTLTFFPPYDNKGFGCDACGSFGGNHWLYRCALCEFDVHLGCAVGSGSAGRAGLNPVSRSASASLGRVQPPARVQPGMGRMGSTGGLLRQVMNGIVEGATEQIGQNLVVGIVGGGGGGGDGGSGSSVLDIGGQILGGILGGDTSS